MKKNFNTITIFVFTLFFSSFLTGCLPAVFVVGAAGAGAGGAAVASDKRPVDTMLKDRNIANLALKKIYSDPQLKQRARIAVAVFNRNVLLVGQTPTSALRERAYDLAKSIPGIKRIYNEITIQSPLSKFAQTEDSWITTKVRAKLVAEKGLNSSQIKVVTENNVVYLMGIVTHRQAEITTDIARQVEGVHKVVKLFEYEQ